jgi:anti-sigma regulatory factor (Ser/Thr protein kinase)
VSELGEVAPAPEPGEPASRVLHREGRYPAAPVAASNGRRLATDALRDWGLLPLLDVVLVVVSELVTNAVKHVGQSKRETGDGDVAVRLRYQGRCELFVEVADDDCAPLALGELGTNTEELDESGRGLLIVAGLADEWGVSPAQNAGKVVWAEFAVDGGCRVLAG